MMCLPWLLSLFSRRPGKAGGMSKSAHLVAGESRWFALSVVLAAVTLTPAAAEASPKLANVKAKMGSKAACPVAAGQPQQAAPADISRAISGGAPSALDRIRAEQAGAAPVEIGSAH